MRQTRDDKVCGWQWHQLDHMQTICTSLQTDNYTNTSSLNFYRPDALLTPNQQCQSIKGPASDLEIKRSPQLGQYAQSANCQVIQRISGRDLHEGTH